MEDWRLLHYRLMKDFLTFLNMRSNKYILKGGTSLLFCYNSTRFSENIELDGFDEDIFEIVDLFVLKFRYKYFRIKYRIVLNTKVLKSIVIYYGGKKPLSINVSYKKTIVDDQEYCIKNEICVYRLSSLLTMKLVKFNSNENIRDLYDIVFIYNNYKDLLNPYILFILRDAVAFKGLEQFDYLIRSQTDELIDNSKLWKGFLSMYYDLDLV